MSPAARQQILTLFTCVSALGLAACGGSDTAATAPAPSPAPAPAATTVSGSAVKGPVANATVTIKDATTGATLATGGTDAAGAYALSVAQATGDVVIEITGGTYTDEATNAATTLATPLRNVLTLTGGAVQGYVTPLTTLAYTYAFGASTTGLTAAAFNAKASSVATQFQLPSINAQPVVSGSVNAYGQVLRGLSQYLSTQNVTLQAFTTTAYTAAQWSTLTSLYNTAYKTANPTSNVSFSFTGDGLTVGGTGTGGGSGTCGIGVSGSVTSAGFTVPLNLNYCVSGIAAGSCSADNASLSQSVTGQGGVAGAVNLKYTYSASCAAGAVTIALK